MYFASPLWLLASVPWAGVALWLLWGRRPRTLVSFLELWRGPALQKPARRALQPPPIYLALVLAGILVALFAAAGPAFQTRRPGNPITIIVDLGMTMSASNPPRFVTASEVAKERIFGILSSATPVELVLIPGGSTIVSTVGQWSEAITSIHPTAIDTRAAVDQMVRERLVNFAGTIVLISDHQPPSSDPRLIQFPPTGQVENVGIVSIAARQTPAPQVMVRVWTDSGRKSVRLRVESGSERAEQSVELPARGLVKDIFVDLPRLGDSIEASLDSHDDLPADGQAALVREGSFPRIEQHAALPSRLLRMVDVYSKLRPPGEGSQVVSIVTAEGEIPSAAPAVVVPLIARVPAHGIVTVTAHLITSAVNWNSLALPVMATGDAPVGWQPVVKIGGRTIVAVRDGSVRDVWVGFDDARWATTPDYIVFWSNVFSWVGRGQERYTSSELGSWNNGWKLNAPQAATPTHIEGTWPGIYRTAGGAVAAFNAPALPIGLPPAEPSDWRLGLGATGRSGGGAYPLSTIGFLVAMAFLATAALTWKRSP
jgi:hypothetical protein